MWQVKVPFEKRCEQSSSVFLPICQKACFNAFLIHNYTKTKLKLTNQKAILGLVKFLNFLFAKSYIEMNICEKMKDNLYKLYKHWKKKVEPKRLHVHRMAPFMYRFSTTLQRGTVFYQKRLIMAPHFLRWSHYSSTSKKGTKHDY